MPENNHAPLQASRLLIDAGNSAVKCIHAKGRQLQLASLRSFAHDDPALTTFLNTQLHDSVCEVLIASVAAIDWPQRLHRLSPEHTTPIRQLHSPATHPLLRNGYQQAAQLGVDRWLAMLGARLSTAAPICVVDLGTATTLDAIDAQGQHLGGWILPGLGTSQKALRQAGHLLAQSAPGCSQIFAHNTADAIHSGCLHAQVASIERFMGYLHQAYNADQPLNTAVPASGQDDSHFRRPGPRLFLTGGWAQAVLGLLSYEAVFDPYLVFRGILAQGLERNDPAPPKA